MDYGTTRINIERQCAAPYQQGQASALTKVKKQQSEIFNRKGVHGN